MTDGQVRDNRDRSRYELAIAGEIVSYAEYTLDGNDIAFTHTYTEPPLRDNGYAAIVVEAALDDAGERHLTVHPHCWFVAEFISEHPRYRDLLAS